MESIKHPGTILATIDAVALIGVTAYFYKQNQALQAEVIKLTESQAALAKKILELQTVAQQLPAMVELIKQLQATSGKTTNSLKQLGVEVIDRLDELEESSEGLASTLADNGFVPAEPKPQYKGRPTKRGAKRPDVKKRWQIEEEQPDEDGDIDKVISASRDKRGRAGG